MSELPDRKAWVSKLTLPDEVSIIIRSIDGNKVHFTRLKERRALGSTQIDPMAETAFIDIPENEQLAEEKLYPVDWQGRISGDARFKGFKAGKPVWEIDLSRMVNPRC